MGKLSFKKLLGKCSGLADQLKLETFSDIALLVATTYLLINRTTGFSFFGWLVENVFHQEFVDILRVLTAALLVVIACVKAGCLFFKAFPLSTHVAREPENIATCIKVINDEVYKHIVRCASTQPLQATALTNEHSFDLNLRSVVHCLAEHILATVNANLRRRDLFISVYSYCSESRELKYELHSPARSDLVNSRIIKVDDPSYADYESVKSILSSASTSYVPEKVNYAKGQAKRYKTVKQYMGCKLEHNSKLFGFLSIEFHRLSPFIDESQMEVFMEEHVFPFRLLIEYQYLKSSFFGDFSKLIKNQQVA